MFSIFLVVRPGAPRNVLLAFARSRYSLVLFPLGKPHPLRLGLVARTSSTAPGLPAFFREARDLVPDLGHPPGDGLLVTASFERVGELEAHARQGA